MQDQAPDQQQGQQEKGEHECHFRIRDRLDGVRICIGPADRQPGVGRQVDYIDRCLQMPSDPGSGKAKKQEQDAAFPKPAKGCM